MPSIATPAFQVVVLHPKHMIRDKLWFAGRSSIVSPAQNLPAAGPGLLFVDNGRLRIRDDDGNVIDYPPFHHYSNREATNKVNIYLVLLNAQAKFEHHTKHFGLDKLSADDRLLIDLTNQIVEALYFVPMPAAGSPGEALDAARATRMSRLFLAPARSPGDTTRKSPQTTQQRGAASGSGGQTGDQISSSSSYSDLSGSPIPVDNGYNSQDMYPTYLSTIDDHNLPDDDYGLTHEEMDILEDRMKDPTLTSKERAEAGTMFMFGNKCEFARILFTTGIDQVHRQHTHHRLTFLVNHPHL